MIYGFFIKLTIIRDVYWIQLHPSRDFLALCELLYYYKYLNCENFNTIQLGQAEAGSYSVQGGTLQADSLYNAVSAEIL